MRLLAALDMLRSSTDDPSRLQSLQRRVALLESAIASTVVLPTRRVALLEQARTLSQRLSAGA